MMFSKRTLINIGLIVLVFALSYYVRKNPVDNAQEVVSSLQAADVYSIVIQRSDGSEFLFEKETATEQWFMRSPFAGPANQNMIAQVLKTLTLKSRYRHDINKESQRNRYQLAPPIATLFLNDQQFDFGTTNDFNQYRYVLHKGTVHTLKDIILHTLNSTPESFLNTPPNSL